MAFVPHVKMTCSGTLGLAAMPPEIFSFGLNIAVGGDFGGTVMPGTIARTACETAVKNMFSAAGSRISSAAKLTEIKWALIGEDGLYAAPPISHFTSTAGGGAGAINAPQIAVCVTLDGPDAVRRVTGRYYLPLPDVTPGTQDLVISVGQRDQILTAQETMINTINTALAQELPGGSNVPRVVIASQGRTRPVTPPANHTVERIRVGVVLDTQRRRRNNLVENYGLRPIPLQEA